MGAPLFGFAMPWQDVPAPAIGPEGTYEVRNGRTIRVYEHVNARLILDDLLAKLELFAG